ncbi:hypothetical protein GQ600_13198 [Phytophthora cactorum]|nr:hypothetical protein GQ600_13198 [Phytophthora cactorum]
MYLALKTHFGEDGLASVLVKAVESPQTKPITAKLQEEVWRTIIFKLLKLKEEIDKLFENPAISTWVSDVTKLGVLDKTKPSEFRVISELEKTYTSMSWQE